VLGSTLLTRGRQINSSHAPLSVLRPELSRRTRASNRSNVRRTFFFRAVFETTSIRFAFHFVSRLSTVETNPSVVVAFYCCQRTRSTQTRSGRQVVHGSFSGVYSNVFIRVFFFEPVEFNEINVPHVYIITEKCLINDIGQFRCYCS